MCQNNSPISIEHYYNMLSFYDVKEKVKRFERMIPKTANTKTLITGKK